MSDFKVGDIVVSASSGLTYEVVTLNPNGTMLVISVAIGTMVITPPDRFFLLESADTEDEDIEEDYQPISEVVEALLSPSEPPAPLVWDEFTESMRGVCIVTRDREAKLEAEREQELLEAAVRSLVEYRGY